MSSSSTAIVTASTPDRRTSRDHRLRAFLCVLVALLLAGCATASPESEPSPTTGAPVLYVLGDSYATGFTHGEDNAYPEVIEDRTCWDVEVDGEDGTGYVNPGSRKNGQLTYLERVPRAVTAHPRIVLIQGSDNDIRYPPDQITRAAERTYDAVHTALPDARLVAVGPIQVPAVPLPQLERVRDALVQATSAKDVQFIDPIELHWLSDPRLFEADGAHPTMRGHRQLASDVIRQLWVGGSPTECGPPSLSAVPSGWRSTESTGSGVITHQGTPLSRH
jgi:acyl-CoA thioesterase I